MNLILKEKKKKEEEEAREGNESGRVVFTSI